MTSVTTWKGDNLESRTIEWFFVQHTPRLPKSYSRIKERRRACTRKENRLLADEADQGVQVLVEATIAKACPDGSKSYRRQAPANSTGSWLTREIWV